MNDAKGANAMNDERSSRRGIARLGLALVTVLSLAALCPPEASAQPRYYWKTLTGANAVPLIYTSASGNTNPFDPAHIVAPGANFEATLAMMGYARTFSMFDRAAMAAVILPMGRISGNAGGAVITLNQQAHGFGDPTFEFDVNVLGPPAQKNLVDALRYEPKFSLDLLADLAVPIGEYDSSQALNLGQNRWYGRLGTPIVWQLGPWVPGRRTTLEFIPAVWFFGANDNYVGQTLKTNPMFQLDAHLTRDFTEKLWGSFDGAWYKGGQASIDGVEGEELNNLGFGLTLGYQLNDNLGLAFGYKSTVNDSAPGDLQMDGFTVTLISGWHSLIEGARRLEKEK
jgi:outer membrane putative beta-barrel porin/alpha-amylase